MQGRIAAHTIQRALDTEAAQASEGRWPRICERVIAGGAVRVRRVHVF